MKNNIRTTFILLLTLSLTFSLLSELNVKAADNGTVEIENLEVGDLVEIYRIANYDEDDEDYTWATAVSNWLSSTTTGKTYGDLTPAKFTKLTNSGAKEFCQLLLMGLKNDSTGVANLTGESFTVEEVTGNTVSLVPGYYIILPKGLTRVYELKWFELAPSEEVTLTYIDTDYYLPSITSTIENTTEDRGTQLDTGNPLFQLEDRAEVTSIVTPPDYTLMYSNGKRVLNISLIIPNGFDFLDNSLFLYQEESETSDDETDSDETSSDETVETTESESFESISSDLYSKQQFKDAKLYLNNDGEMLYFGQSGYYYEMDGSLLTGPEATDETALAAYNEKYETSYEYENTSYEVITSDTEDETEDDSETETDDESDTETDDETDSDTEDDGTVETTAINAEEEETDNTNIISILYGNTIFIISMDTEEEFGDIKAVYTATKNEASATDGWYSFKTALNYSVSPLDSNLHALVTKEAKAGSYGIALTACLGYADSYLKTADELLSDNPRMSEDEFILYKKSDTYDGDITQAATQVTQNETTIELIYDEDTNITTEYTQVKDMVVDEDGEVSIGGLEPNEYLIMQVAHVTGYDLSPMSLIIEEDDWTDDTEMEGNCEYQVIWLDYKTVYLPATGGYGRENTQALGIVILLCVALIMAQRYRKNIFIC